MDIHEKKELAYRIYPLPNGTIYYHSDLISREKVELLFDYCQILEAVIFEDGWEVLINYHGIDTLYEINKKSGWFDCNSLDEYMLYIKSYIADISTTRQ